MIEIPEAVNLARQLNEVLAGKKIESALAGSSPHGFAWYCGDPASYSARLMGKIVSGVTRRGGHLWIQFADETNLILAEGPVIRVWSQDEKPPFKHQLFIRFEDGSSLSVTVRMYAFIFLDDGFGEENPYLQKAVEGPDPLSDIFDLEFFKAKITSDGTPKMTLKGFLATQQRFPGLGNGVLHDILLNARLHPKRLIMDLKESESEALFRSVKETLKEMTELGGRESEMDINGEPGGYATKLSKKSIIWGCPECGSHVIKETFLGGSIYFCPNCQGLA
jgi:formamidopyrimidine-DNA glycosylase